MVGPLGQAAAEISAMLIVGLCFLGLLFAGLKPFWSESETPSDILSKEPAQQPADLRRLVTNCFFQPMSQWVVFAIVGMCVTPFAPSAAVLAAILAAVWIVVRGFVRDRNQKRSDDGGISRSATETPPEMQFDNFVLVRLLRSAVEVAPRSFGGCVVWLAAWLAPAFVWAIVFFIQEDRIRLAGSSFGIRSS